MGLTPALAQPANQVAPVSWSCAISPSQWNLHARLKVQTFEKVYTKVQLNIAVCNAAPLDGQLRLKTTIAGHPIEPKR